LHQVDGSPGGDSPEYRRPSRLFVTGTAACAVLLAGTALRPAGARVPAWGLLDVVYLVGYAVVILTSNRCRDRLVRVTRRLAGEDPSPARLAEGAGPEPSAGADGG
jgi:hypothetical protein